jgi:flagellar P-ring protein precursor FlgI
MTRHARTNRAILAAPTPRRAATLARAAALSAPFAALAARLPAVVRAVLPACAALFAILAATPAVHAGDLQEYARLRGLEGDRFVGLGLVYGLNKSGDNMKDSAVAAQPYAQLLSTLGNIRSDFKSLSKTRSVAVVLVSVEIPRTGARSDDRLDVTIGTLGNATSLAGGILLTSPLKSPIVPADRALWQPFAVAEGTIEVDPESPTTGIIRGGARMVRDVVMSPFDGDSVSLVLHPQYAGYPTASSLADLINDELSVSGYADAARVEDAQTIRVRIPAESLPEANEFVARLLTFHVPHDLVRTPARVVIDTAARVITVDERVEFRPSAVTAANLRITTITPPIEPSAAEPLAETVAWTGLGTGDGARDRMKLRTLIEQLVELDVPFETQVAIIESLSRQGALKAEVLKS